MEYYWLCRIDWFETVSSEVWTENDGLFLYSAHLDTRNNSLYPRNDAIQVSSLFSWLEHFPQHQHSVPAAGRIVSYAAREGLLQHLRREALRCCRRLRARDMATRMGSEVLNLGRLASQGINDGFQGLLLRAESDHMPSSGTTALSDEAVCIGYHQPLSRTARSTVCTHQSLLV